MKYKYGSPREPGRHLFTPNELSLERPGAEITDFFTLGFFTLGFNRTQGWASTIR
jgi:hypothetical protein